ncbi:hypothetical protein NKG94_18165 [Micromonospora sp. M12]
MGAVARRRLRAHRPPRVPGEGGLAGTGAGPEIARLAGRSPTRYAGSLADVLRLAVPPRHARVEKEPATISPPRRPAPISPPRRPAPGGRPAWVAGLPDRPGPAARARRRPGAPRGLVGTARRGLGGPLRRRGGGHRRRGRGAVVVVPDARDLDRLDAALTGVLGPGGTSACPPRSARPGATGRSSPPAGDRYRW